MGDHYPNAPPPQDPPVHTMYPVYARCDPWPATYRQRRPDAPPLPEPAAPPAPIERGAQIGLVYLERPVVSQLDVSSRIHLRRTGGR